MTKSDFLRFCPTIGGDMARDFRQKFKIRVQSCAAFETLERSYLKTGFRGKKNFENRFTNKEVIVTYWCRYAPILAENSVAPAAEKPSLRGAQPRFVRDHFFVVLNF